MEEELKKQKKKQKFMKEHAGKMKINKAVIPAAGLGTRFLPITKAMPKEMLPLVDTPVIHYVVKEAVDSGIDDIIIITGRNKRPLEDYFDLSPELEMHLKKNNKINLLKKVKEISKMADIHYIRQKKPKGLADAILKSEKHISGDPFAVLLGDDIIKSDVPCTKQLMKIYNKYKSTVLAVQKVSVDEVHKYGIIDGKEIDDTLIELDGIIEKPSIDNTPSDIASIGRYVFTPEIFDSIKNTKPGHKNELQITDSIKILNKKQKVYAYSFKGKRYDTGDKQGYVNAFIDFSKDIKLSKS